MADRERNGRDAPPSATVIDSQTVGTADQTGDREAMVGSNRGAAGATQALRKESGSMGASGTS
jgi:hypothetical protein